MKISVVVPLYTNETSKVGQLIKLFRQQTIGYKNIELVFLCNESSGELKEQLQIPTGELNTNIIFTKDKLDIGALKGEYVSFCKLSYKFRLNVYEEMYNLIRKKEYDFVSIPLDIKGRASIDDKNILGSDFDTLTSLKLIKKETLMRKEFSFLSKGNIEDISYVNVKLYLMGVKYAFSPKINYKDKAAFDDQYIIHAIDEMESICNLLIKDYGSDFDGRLNKLLMKRMLYLADKNIFLDQVEVGYQQRLFNTLRELHSISNNDVLNDSKVYHGFINLLSQGLDEEAIQYMKLLRSKRYWYGQSQKYEKYFEKNPHNLTDSLSWKVTKPIRYAETAFRNIKEIMYKAFIIFLSLFVKIQKGNKEIWLIGEREDQAEDNGYFFFKYCRENHTRQKVYYIINKDSPHVEKVKKYGNVIYHSSLKHKVYMLAADMYLSAWVFEECSYPKPNDKFIRLFKKNIANKRNICLQHGVIIQNISPYLRKDKYNQDFIISSSEAEKKIIMQTLGYEDEDVLVTGLARFDNLQNRKTKKQILIMPTWRRELSNVSRAQFVQSEYYQTYRNLLTRKSFLDMIEQHNISVKFYVHSQMQKFMSEFEVDHPNIEFLIKANSIVSELLKESALLITDYSSVSLDFLYMDKPVVLYQFDPHNNHHVPTKEIKYSDIGKIVSTEDDLIKNVKEIVDNKFKTNKQYLKNSNRIFKYKDGHNSERIYELIKQKKS
ncbi:MULTISPECIES: CDP-glycerol glycerophosphotransferase family protein [unclassified Bacillus cereus group]|uniref:bifunctional glycosyltransferase/CDP-glycerol:glycerophosphate glycerophosphotransferase n=1 Tax=unclassified Bacillus cereus group TaxID=2750818 RepID=UPI001F593FB2|nr:MULTISPECIES: CDP-glycerol glycerophosphotransferase family protein [unclassified Bacillus cereus group]